MTLLGIAVTFAAVIWIVAIIVLKRRGVNVKVWDPKLQRYV